MLEEGGDPPGDYSSAIMTAEGEVAGTPETDDHIRTLANIHELC